MAQILTEPKPIAKKSLLTSMLGDKGKSLVSSPVPQFDQHSLASSPPQVVEEQLDHVLTTWERAWTGVGVGGAARSGSRAGTPSGTSPQPHGDASQATSSGQGQQAPIAIMAGSGAASSSGAIAIAGSISKAVPMPTGMPLPATPPPPNRVMAAPIAAASRQGADADARPDGDAAPMIMPLPATPSPHHRLGSTPAPATRPATATPINVHHPTIPKNAKDSNDFASVFFSPLPYSYLNMAHSDSTDQLLAQSVGSPDVTLRGGRLASTTAMTMSEWPEHPESLSPNSAGSKGSHPLSIGNAAGSVSPRDDVTSHGNKRGTPTLGTSLGSAGSALGLVGHALQRPQAPTGTGDAEKVRGSTVSPDSVLVTGTLETATSNASTTSVSGDGTKPATAVAPLTGQITVVRPPSHATSLSPGEPSILIRSPSPRPVSSPTPPFTAHPAVASLVMSDGGPALPGMDLLQANGMSSIAAAVDNGRRGQPAAPGTALRLVASAAMIPHVDKADKGGEDAYCIVPIGLGAIGVADGVSGWAEEGIDPAEYSRTLMRYCASALHEAAGSADAREVIRYAHNSTVMPGSSTVCLAVMKPGGKLEVANLGDSGVRIVRNGQIIFASAAQQHMFNMPFQLSHPSIIESPDDADSADVTVLDVQPGDVVVLATDGLYDNMFDDEIAQICGEMQAKQYRSFSVPSADAPPSPDTVAKAALLAQTSKVFSDQDASTLAHTIARTAHKYAQNPYQRTPWSVTSCEQGFAWARFFAKGGGKMDDCTVIVAFVQATE